MRYLGNDDKEAQLAYPFVYSNLNSYTSTAIFKTRGRTSSSLRS